MCFALLFDIQLCDIQLSGNTCAGKCLAPRVVLDSEQKRPNRRADVALIGVERLVIDHRESDGQQAEEERQGSENPHDVSVLPVLFKVAF